MDKDAQRIAEACQQDPDLKNCFLEMLDITESPLGTLDNGDDAEEAVISSIRKTGRELLKKWARKKAEDAKKLVADKAENRFHEKKKFIWQTSIGKIEIVHECFLRKKSKGELSKRLKPLEDITGIKNKKYSIRCQKLMTDFGAEESFYQAAKRMKEHHGVDINPGTIRETTEKYARKASEAINRLPTRREKSDQMIVEMDGEMVPLVEYEESKDRRKTKRLLWSELRIGTVQNIGEVNWGYACSFESPDHLGQRIKVVMKRFGFYERTEVHSVGDGAKWIPEQGEKLAGANFHHLIDLPHLCEYLNEAASAWTENTKDEVKKFKKELFEGGVNKSVEA